MERFGFIDEEMVRKAFELLARIAAPREASDTLVRAELREIAQSLGDQKLRERFSRAGVPLREQIGVLEYASQEQISKLIRKLFVLAAQHEDVRDFVRTKIDNVLYYTSEAEKIDLIKMMAGDPRRRTADPFIHAAFRSAANLEELSRLVQGAGTERLVATKDRDILEYVALAKLGAELRALKMPSRLEGNVPSEQIAQHAQEIRNELKRGLEIVASDPGLSRTLPARDFRHALEYDLNYLDKLLELSDAKLQVDRLNMLSSKVQLEMRFGISLTIDTTGKFGAETHWNEFELQHLRIVLDTIGEGLILTTPLLHEIQKVTDLRGWAGRRFPEGTVRIAGWEDQAPGREPSYFQLLLAHELGHSIQLGRNNLMIRKTGNGEMLVSVGDHRYDMPDFYAVSGWTAIAPNRYKSGGDGKTVILDGERASIGKPIRVGDKEVVLIYQEGILGYYDAKARFISDYARTNPLEDWADSFADYQLQPLKLIKEAPLKFLYFDQEFRRYDRDQAIRGKLADSLRDAAAGR